MSIRLIKVNDPNLFIKCLALRKLIFIDELHIDPYIERDGYDNINLRADHFLIEYNGMNIGNIRVIKEDKKTIDISRFGILKEYRGQGIGMMTLRMIEYFYYNRSYDHIVADVFVSAYDLFARCSYTKASKEMSFTNIPYIKMEKYLQ